MTLHTIDIVIRIGAKPVRPVLNLGLVENDADIGADRDVAERLLERWKTEWKGDIEPVFEACAY